MWSQESQDTKIIYSTLHILREDSHWCTELQCSVPLLHNIFRTCRIQHSETYERFVDRF